MSARGQKPDMKTLRPATQLVHGGTMRSQFGETSEALFLTQGYAYPDMETAEARMKGAEPGYVYSRYGRGIAAALWCSLDPCRWRGPFPMARGDAARNKAFVSRNADQSLS
jgi:cystathionine beta-lyase/cystathionine gamma-synthase